MAGRCRPWEVWVATVKFDDSDEVKKRPVVITDTGAVVLLALKITTHAPRREFDGEYVLSRWSAAGLTKPSTVRMMTTLRLEERDLHYKMGTLHTVDILAIQAYLRESAVSE